MVNAEGIKTYIASVRKHLGEDWLNDADHVHTVSIYNVGGISFLYALQCYMNDVPAKDCADKLKEKFDE